MQVFGRLIRNAAHASAVQRRYVLPVVCILFVSLLWSVPVLSQTRTGSVAGFVRSADGNVVENASVKVAGVEVTRNSKTDKRGYYLAPSLPPGEYTVTVEAEGMGATVYKGLVIEVATAARLDLTLRTGVSVRENVTVTAESMQVQTSETKSATVVNNKILESLPMIDRNFMESIKLIPGVSGSGDALSISGGEDMQKNFNIDGVDNNDIAQINKASANGYNVSSNKSFSGFDQEAIQELSVSTSGYGADQGYGSGGVINVVTKSGTNDVHGSGYLTARNDALDTDITSAYKEYMFGGSIGGPIKKDKLYYFANVGGILNDTGFDNRAYFYQWAPTSLSNNIHNLTSFVKLSWKLTPNQTINISSNIYRSSGDYWDAGLHYAEDIVAYAMQNRNITGNISHTAVLGTNSVLDSTISYAFSRNNRKNPPGTHAGWIFYVVPEMHASGENQGDYWDTKDKMYWSEKISHNFSNHTFSAGFDYRWFRSNDKRGAQDMVSFYPYEWWGDPVEFHSIQDPFQLVLKQSYLGAFVNDSWRITRKLTLNAGLRISRDSFLKDVVPEPRIGLAYDPTGKGKTVVRGAFSVYSDRVNLYAQEIANASFVNNVYYNHDGTLAFESPQTFQPTYIDPNLKNPRTYEGSAGIDQQLGGGFILSGNYIYRDYQDEVFGIYANLLDPVTLERPDPTKGVLTEMANKGWSKYQGFFVSVRKTGGSLYQLMASYGYQRSHGNATWLAGMGSTNIIIGDPYTMTTDTLQVYMLSGRTDYDRPYEIKMYGELNIPKTKGLFISGVVRLMSGSPYSSYDGMTYTLVGEFQDKRMPKLFYLDTRLKKEFKFGERYVLAIMGEAFNVTNHKNVMTMANDVSQSNYGDIMDIDSSRRIQLGARFTF